MMWSIDFKPFQVDLVTTWWRSWFSRIVIYDLLMEISFSISMLVSRDKNIGPYQEGRILHRMLSSLSIHTTFSLLLRVGWYVNPTRKSLFLFLFFVIFFFSRRYSMLELIKKIFLYFIFKLLFQVKTYAPSSLVCIVVKFNSINWHLHILC